VSALTISPLTVDKLSADDKQLVRRDNLIELGRYEVEPFPLYEPSHLVITTQLHHFTQQLQQHGSYTGSQEFTRLKTYVQRDYLEGGIDDTHIIMVEEHGETVQSNEVRAEDLLVGWCEFRAAYQQ